MDALYIDVNKTTKSLKMNESKKVDKKCKRYAARLQSSKGVTCTEKPRIVSFYFYKNYCMF